MRLSVKKHVVTSHLCDGKLTHGVKNVDQHHFMQVIKDNIELIDHSSNQSGEYLYLTPFFIAPIVERSSALSSVITFHTHRTKENNVSICSKTTVDIYSLKNASAVESVIEQSLIDLLQNSGLAVCGNANTFSFQFANTIVIDHSTDDGRTRLGIAYLLISNDLKFLDQTLSKDLGYNTAGYLLDQYGQRLDTWSKMILGQYVSDFKQHQKASCSG